MKFMKLGSKPDVFRTGEDKARYVDMELASDIIVIVGDAKFHLHKFPLLSKSTLLQSLVGTTSPKGSSEVHILNGIPGGATTFEMCAKFCYGMVITLNAHNVVATRCAAEYLGMFENMEKGNLIYKIDAFFNSCIFPSWKESIIALQTTKSMHPWADDLKLITHCIESISSMASIDTSKVQWCYSYNEKKLSKDNNSNTSDLDPTHKVVPKDWWVEDLCELEIGLFENVVRNVKNKGVVCDEVIGEAIKAYVYRNLPIPTKGVHHYKVKDVGKVNAILEAIVGLLPLEKGSVSCSFLLKLLKVSLLVDAGEMVREILVKKIGQQLDEATVGDLLIPASKGEGMKYNVDVVQQIVGKFLDQEFVMNDDESGSESKATAVVMSSEVSLLLVLKLIDAYMAEVAKDRNLPVSTFLGLAEMVPSESRQAHDALYRAIDTYLKEHPDIDKSDRKRMCKLIDCKKLCMDACMHAVQNERLPMRMIIQVLFYEQVRATMTSGMSTPDLPRTIQDLNNGSGRSTACLDDDWDAVATIEEIKTLKTELASMSSTSRDGTASEGGGEIRVGFEKVILNKMMKGLMPSKRRLGKMWSNKSLRSGKIAYDDMKSSSFNNLEEARSTPSRNTRISIS